MSFSSLSAAAAPCTGSLSIALPSFLVTKAGGGSEGTCKCHESPHKDPPDFNTDSLYFRATVSSEEDCTDCELQVEITGPGIAGSQTAPHPTSGEGWGFGDWHNW